MQTSTSTALDAGRVAALAASVSGVVWRPDDDGFAAECAAFNLLVTHRPALVVGATGPADVQAAVRFATAHDLPVGVFCTGHQDLGPADGGMMITTGRMDAVTIDPGRRTARVEAGAWWGDVVEQATSFGLAPLNGSSPRVGVAGYILGGGLSPLLGRTYGWAADHVHAIEVVTADGRLRRVTASADPDLFWALRGGRSNFGVVTALEIALFPVTTLYAGVLYYDGEHTARVLRAYRELTRGAPEEFNSSIALLRLPALPFAPEPLRDRLVVHVRISYLGAAVDGERLIATLRSAVPTIIDTVDGMAYGNFAEVHEEPAEPMPFNERGMLLADLPAEGIEAIAELAGPDSGSEVTMLEIRHLGGALAREPRVPSAVTNRDARFAVYGVAVGAPEQTKTPIAQLEAILDRLRKWSTGRSYLNFMTGADPAADAYSPAVYERLRAVKAIYDPGNLFRVNNHNILPRGLG
jgi:FAD/FMN-containing dehydrogenase